MYLRELVMIFLLSAASLAPAQRARARGAQESLQEALDRAAPGATVRAAEYPDWDGPLLIRRSVSLVGGHFSAPIRIMAPAKLFDVRVRLEHAAPWTGAIVVETGTPLFLDGCRVWTVGNFGVLAGSSALWMDETIVQAWDPELSLAVTGKHALVTNSMLHGDYAISTNTLAHRGTVFDGEVRVWEAELVEGGHAQ